MKSKHDLHAKTTHLAVLLTAVALFALGQATQAGMVVADYATEVKAPAASAALDWTYWKANVGVMTTKVSLDDTNWDGTNYTDYADTPSRSWSKLFGSTQGAPILVGMVNPAANEWWNVARWTSDVTSTSFDVSGVIQRWSTGADQYDFFIRKNDGALYSLTMSGGDTSAHPYAFSVLGGIAVGDTIDLVFYDVGGDNGQLMKIGSTFSIPEPASLTLLAGLAGVLMSQRRRRR